MSRQPRFLIAMILAAFYTIVIMTPLAPIAMRSPFIAHAVTGECVGDCAVCGCSRERSAGHTCCCWQKKLLHDYNMDREPECCRKKHHDKPVLTCNCPCDSTRLPGLWGSEKLDQLPYRFITEVPVIHCGVLVSSHNYHLVNRHIDPPDPPPKLSIPA